MFKIGNVEIKNNIVLAPMAGVSNYPYIKICEEMGVGYAVTELISAEAIIRSNKKTLDMLRGYDKLNIPIAIQIFGSNADTMAKAAKYISENKLCDIIDINMGCPVPKVALRSQAGSALLKDPNKVYEIVKAVKETVNIPVTVKIRSGWDSNSINAVEIAKVCEKAGADAIAVHPRTRKQGYSGVADLSIIKAVKENVGIPVIGNGDIKSCYDAKKMLDYTGCDAVMIGRGLLGNPWIVRECIDYLEENKEPRIISKKEKIEMIKKHYSYLIKTKPEKTALLEMRMFIPWYLKGLNGSNDVKKKIYMCHNFLEIDKILNEYMEGE